MGSRKRLWLLMKMHFLGCLDAKSNRFYSLFPKGAKICVFATGFRFAEGPIWLMEKGCLLFSDIPASRIYEIASDGKASVFKEPSGNSNGLTLDRQGRLIVCEHGNRRITRIEKDGNKTVLAASFQGKKLNSPNDVVVKSDGSIYFTDPPYGIEPEDQEQPIQGVYRISPEGDDLRVVADDFLCPNGLAFSPDEKRLYIDDSSERRHIRVFDVHADGTLANGGIFYDMNVRQPGAPDGMKVDVHGHVYCTGARGVWVFDARGLHLGTIMTPEKPANCAWGDGDMRTLYITAQTSLYKIRVNVPGIPVL
jgi:gluconolactonase